MLRGAFVVLLALGMLPLVPASPVVEEAEALEGTTNYGDFFVIAHRDGRPGSITGNVLVGAATDYSWQYGYRERWASSSMFLSKRPVSLLHDWQVRLKANLAEPRAGKAPAGVTNLGSNLQIGLAKENDPTTLNTSNAGLPFSEHEHFHHSFPYSF